MQEYSLNKPIVSLHKYSHMIQTITRALYRAHTPHAAPTDLAPVDDLCLHSCAHEISRSGNFHVDRRQTKAIALPLAVHARVG